MTRERERERDPARMSVNEKKRETDFGAETKYKIHSSQSGIFVRFFLSVWFFLCKPHLCRFALQLTVHSNAFPRFWCRLNTKHYTVPFVPSLSFSSPLIMVPFYLSFSVNLKRVKNWTTFDSFDFLVSITFSVPAAESNNTRKHHTSSLHCV